MKYLSKNFKKGVSLAEVLIVLAVISTTMVSAMGLVVNTMVAVKKNEIEDTANGIMIKALEITKSPSDVVINTTTSLSSTSQYFTLTLGATQEESAYLDFVPAGESLGIDCPEGSVFSTNITNLEGDLIKSNICLQMEIKKIDSLNEKDFYEIIAKVVYAVPNEDPIVNTLKGYRSNDFIYR